MTTKTMLLRAVRAKCVDCCCHQSSEVKLCTAKGCELWPYRLGMDPNPSRRSAVKNLSPAGGVFDGKAGKAVDHAK